jgi:hypothetical protein
MLAGLKSANIEARGSGPSPCGGRGAPAILLTYCQVIRARAIYGSATAGFSSNARHIAGETGKNDSFSTVQCVFSPKRRAALELRDGR